MGGTPSKPPTHPKTPLAVTLRGQKGYQSAPFSIPHPSTYSPYWKSELQQSYATKIEQRTPMHTCPSRHPQLACKSTNCPPDFTIYNHIIHYRYPGSLNWFAACSPLHPLPPTPMRAWHWLPAMHTDPPFTQFTQSGCQSTVLELRNLMVSLEFCRSGPKKFWRGCPKNSNPPSTTHHPPSPRIGPICTSIDRF